MTRNHFEFYGLTPAFALDENLLKERFIQKSKSLHPDFFTLDSEEKQEEILELSAYNNTAYKVLKDEQKRYRYVLELFDVHFEEGKESVPQDFLMEMMDINEAIMGLEMNPSADGLTELKGKLDELNNSLEAQKVENIRLIGEISIINDKISASNALNLKGNLLNIKGYLLKKKYLSRIESNLYK